MACPSTEDVTRELIRRLQVHFEQLLGTDVEGKPNLNVYGSGGVTSLEVIDETGAPVIEVTDRPKISVVGPTMRAVTRFGVDPSERVLVSIDEDSLTGVDAPAPLLRHLDYQLVCTALRDSTSASGKRGIQWLQEKVALWGQTGGADGPYLLGDGWTGDEAVGDFRGYLLVMASEPQPMASQAANLRGFSCSITVKDVRITDGTTGEVPLTGEVELTTGLLTT